MRNYYDEILTEEEQADIIKWRFEDYTKVSVVTRFKVSYMLKQEFDLVHEVTIPCPTQKQLEYLRKQIDNLTVNKDVYKASAGLIEQGLGKTKSAILWACWLYQHGYIDKVVVLSPNDLKNQWILEQFPLHACSEWRAHIWQSMTTKKEQKAFERIICRNEQLKTIKEDFKDYDRLKIFSVNIEAMSHTSVMSYMRKFCQCGEDKEVLVVIDESTTIKNGSRKPIGKDTKRKGSKRANAVIDGFANRPFKMILTGTATPNSPFDLWAQFEFLIRNYFGLPLFDFQRRYGEMVYVSPAPGRRKHFELLSPKLYSQVKARLKQYGIGERTRPSDCLKPVCVERVNCGRLDCKIKELSRDYAEMIAEEYGMTESAIQRISEMTELKQHKHLEELKEKMLPISFFCKTEECEDLPEKVFRELTCSMSKEQNQVYKQMQSEMMTVFKGETLSTLYKNVMYMRCQQIAGGLYPYPVELCKKLLVDGEEIEVTKTEYRYKYFDKNPKLDALMEDIETIDKPIIFWARFIEEQRLIYERLKKEYGSESVGWYHAKEKHKVETDFKAGKIRFFVGAKSAARGLNLQRSGNQYFYSNDFEADTRDQKIKRSHRMGRVGACIFTDVMMRATRDRQIMEVLNRKMDMIEFFRKGDVK